MNNPITTTLGIVVWATMWMGLGCSSDSKGRTDPDTTADTTTDTTTENDALGGTCEGRCGAEYDPAAACQCNAACGTFQNCCEDYESVCQPVFTSCEGRCGAAYDRALPCQCNAGCGAYGNCCSDYDALCLPALTSCEGRCGTAYDRALPCQCNDACAYFGNCCADHAGVCEATCDPACAGSATCDATCSGTCGTCPGSQTCSATGVCVELGPESGSCRGPSDLAAFAAKDPWATLWACASQCGGQGAACLVDCIQPSMGLSAECAGCFDPLGVCLVLSCSEECWGAQGGCYGCGRAQCESEFRTCSGLPFSLLSHCTPQCDGKVCGEDGCGGTCGTCGEGLACKAGECVTHTEACGGISFEGCCDGDLVKYCEDGQVLVVPCIAQRTCGWDTIGDYYSCNSDGSPEPTGTHPKACP
ncbi:MAG TPA: hypothetical protein PK095_03215 [Myxococcota bacterium]|nr:hypothetical protein [Myxococcota bacterium]